MDTSIECDHLRFEGFLKVSLEEVLIALRDDAALLSVSAPLENVERVVSRDNAGEKVEKRSLYPCGFDGLRFVEVIESAAVWAAAA